MLIQIKLSEFQYRSGQHISFTLDIGWQLSIIVITRYHLPRLDKNGIRITVKACT